MNHSRSAGLSSLTSLIQSAYSGTRAKRTTADLYQHCRWITDPHYQSAMSLACKQMKALGLDDVELLRFPTGGKRFYGNWKTPRCWNVSHAYLDIRVNGKWIRFADYRKVPTSIMVYAAPTRQEITTELSGISGKNLRGKLVFCDPTDANMARLLAMGSHGIVTDFAPNWEGVRGEKDFRNGHRWDNGTLFEIEKPLAGFSLSRNQGDTIRKAIEEERTLKCRYRISGSLGKGELYCATGCLRGAVHPQDEAVVVAHLYEAGANDNCSGAAAAIEALRTIQSLVKLKKLKAPDRTIRVVFAFEIVGFLAYFERARKFNRRYIAGVNPDMVGEDQKKCRSVLHFYQSPHSMATFADPLLFHLIRKTASGRLSVALKNFIINDNVVADPSIGVPCPALIHLRDRFYHSNEDTPDKVSAESLKRIGGAMAVYLYMAACMNPRLAKETAAVCLRFAKEWLSVQEKQGISPDKLAYFHEVENARLASLEALTGETLDKERTVLERIVNWTSTIKSKKPVAPPDLKKQAERMIPVRTVSGPLTLEHIPAQERKALKFQPHWSTKWNQPIFWADGRRNLYEIFKLANFETGPYDLRDFIEYFAFLKSESLITVRSRRPL